MKTISWIAMLTGLAICAGCASTPPRVTGTEGTNSSLEDASVPLRDADGDTVADADDQCANTEEQALVDDKGCEVRMGAVEGLTFAPDQIILSSSSQQVLDRYVQVMKRYPDISIAIEGHTDNRGTAANNIDLSKARVTSVVSYMMDNGINPDRLKPYGYGESVPRAANATAEGREQNRRIEINVIVGSL